MNDAQRAANRERQRRHREKQRRLAQLAEVGSRSTGATVANLLTAAYAGSQARASQPAERWSAPQYPAWSVEPGPREMVPPSDEPQGVGLGGALRLAGLAIVAGAFAWCFVVRPILKR